MSLPRIPSPDGPVVKPATEEKTYPDKALMGVRILRGDKGNIQCEVGYQAYNYDTNEISDDEDTKERFLIPDLMKEAAISQPLRKALSDLVNILTLKYKQRKLRYRIGQLTDGTKRDNLIAALDNVEVNQLQLTEREPIPPPLNLEERWAK